VKRFASFLLPLDKMRGVRYALLALLGAFANANAQSFPVIHAGQEINPLGTNPTGPGGAIFVGNRMWIGDAVFGLVRCDPLDPQNQELEEPSLRPYLPYK